jgi:hypothetical protein
MFSLAYVILPFADRPPADAIRDSLAPFQRGTRGSLSESMLAFIDETRDLREVHEADITFSKTGNDGIRIEGVMDIFKINTERVSREMQRLGLRRWSIRFADEMDLDSFYERFTRRIERHPETGAFGRWLNPLGQWDWWDLGGRFDGWIVGERASATQRSAAEVNSGPSNGRQILGNIADVLSDALGQDRMPVVDVRNDRNIEMVATLLGDAQEDLDKAYPAAIVLPPGAVAANMRWLKEWPEIGPKASVAWLGLAAEAGWQAIVQATYRRFAGHWAAGIAFHH